MTDMDKLIAAVEAGTAGWYDFSELCEAAWGADCGYRYSENVREAFCNGSLDAAKRLHDALLPGWDYCIDYVSRAKPLVYVQDDGGPTFDGEADTPARAWLLAILKAVNAQERKT